MAALTTGEPLASRVLELSDPDAWIFGVESGEIHDAWRPGAIGLASEFMSQFARMLRRLARLSSGDFQPLSSPGADRAALKLLWLRYRDRILLECRGSNNVDLDELADEINFFSEFLLRRHSAIPVPTIVANHAPGAPYPREPHEVLERMRLLDHAFRQQLSHERAQGECTLSDQARVGRVLLSAILRCGVCDPAVVAALFDALSGPIHRLRDWFYVEVDLPDGPMSAIEHRRIILDPVTAALALRLPSAAIARARQPTASADRARRVRARARTELFPCIEAYFKACRAVIGLSPELPRRGLGRIARTASRARFPKSLRDLLRLRTGHLRIHHPAFLADYACRHVKSSSLPEPVWARLHGLALPATPGPERDADEDGRLDAAARRNDDPGAPSRSPVDPLRPIRAALRAEPPGRRMDAIRSCLSSLPADAAPGVLRLAQWAEDLVLHRQPSGRKAAPGTARYLFGILGARVLATVAGEDPALLSDEDRAELYEAIAADARNPGHQNRLVAALRSFDASLARRTGVSSAEWAVESSPDAVGARVSANLVTPLEYSRLLEHLGGHESAVADPRLKQQAQVLCILGYRLGMRRAEILGLRKIDVQPGPRGDVLVRAYAGRRLKTPNSRRRLPLALLTAAERKSLAALLRTTPESMWLFPEPDNPDDRVPEHRLIPPVKDTLSEITGDDSLHFHHLRHSAASWTLLQLTASSPRWPEWRARLPFLQEVFERQDVVRQTLQSPLRPQGARLWSVAMLLGHASPMTTLGHYIHVMDLLLHSHLHPEPAHGDADLLLAAAGYSLSSRTKSTDGQRVLGTLARRHPDRVTDIERDAMNRPDLSSGGTFEGTFPDMDALVKRWDELPELVSLATDAGETVEKRFRSDARLSAPSTPYQRRAVIRLLETFQELIRNDPESTAQFLRLYSRNFIHGQQCARFSGDDASAVVLPLVTNAVSPLSLRVYRMSEAEGERRRKWIPPADLNSELGGSSKSSYRVALADPGRVSLPPNDAGRWNAAAAASWLCVMLGTHLQP